MCTFSKVLCILRSVTRIMVKRYNCSSATGTCIFGDAATFIKDCTVLFEDIFVVPFLGSALGLTAMYSCGGEIWLHLTGIICPWAGNLIANF